MFTRQLTDPKQAKKIIADWDSRTLESIHMHYAVQNVVEIIKDRINDGESWSEGWSIQELVESSVGYFNNLIDGNIEFDNQAMYDLIEHHYLEDLDGINKLNHERCSKDQTWSNLLKID